MRIALINPVSQTVDRPEVVWKLFGAALQTRPDTDENVHFIKLAGAIAGEGRNVTVYISDCYRPLRSFQPPPKLELRYLKTRCRWLFPPAYIPLMPSLYREIKQGGFDIVQSSDFFSPSTVLASLARRPILVWQEMDQYPTRWLPRLITKMFYKTIGRVIARHILFVPRSNAAAEFLGSLSYPKLLSVIHSGVDTKVFTPLDLDEEYVLVVSRLAHDKGFDFLLEAFKEIHQEMPKIKLLIKGRGPYYNTLLEMIDQFGLRGIVSVDTKRSGPQEMNQIYNRSFLTQIPSWGGILPFTGYESMAAGKPVVSRFSRGLKDIITEGKTGFITPTPGDMAKRVLWLLSHPKERFEMGTRCRELMLDYDLDQVADKFNNCYENIIVRD